MKILITLTLLFVLTSCFKTAGQVKKEQELESATAQISNSQELMADIMTQQKEMQAKLDLMSGKMEELEHAKKSQSENPEIAQLKEQVDLLFKSQEEQKLLIESLKAEHGSKAKEVQTTKANTNMNGNAKELLARGLKNIDAKKYAEAKEQLTMAIEKTGLTPGDVNKAHHGLGVVAFKTKQFEESLVHFSKIFTKYPKSSLAPSSLFYIGKSFKSLGKKEEAKEAFEELKNSYPESKFVKEAKSEMNKI
jgi:TolA-binding protein